jgi:hypothetical protein
LNDPYFFDAAKALAKRLVSEGGSTLEDRITYGFRITVARPPSPTELAKVGEFYKKQLAEYQAKPDPETAAFTMVANVLLNMDEAVTKE